MKQSYISYMGLALVASIWGMNYAVNRWGMQSFDPILFSFLRYSLAVPIFFLILKTVEGNVRITVRDAIKLMGIGLIGVTILETAVLYSIKYTTLSNSSFLTVAPWPVFTALISPLFTKEKITPRLVVGGAFALAGVCFVVLGGAGGTSLQSKYLFGDLLALGVSILGAVFNLSCIPMMHRYSPLRVSSWYMLFGTLFMFPFTWYSWSKVAWMSLPFVSWFAVGYNVLFCTLLAFAVWNASMKTVGATRSNFFRYATPVVATLAGYLFFRETITGVQLGGGLLIFLGLISISLDKGSIYQKDDLAAHGD